MFMSRLINQYSFKMILFSTLIEICSQLVHCFTQCLDSLKCLKNPCHQCIVIFPVPGEALSFYLSRLLGLDNVPAVVLSTTGAGQWSAQNLKTLDWNKDKLVALIQWIPNMDSFRYDDLNFGVFKLFEVLW